MWANYQCLNDCKDAFSSTGSGWRGWKDTKSPYDFDSIMHYSGHTCGDYFITHKNIPSAAIIPYGLYNSKRLSTQDAIQLNQLYECPLPKILQCTASTFAARSAYLASRHCDGICDCESCSDETDCNVDQACTGDVWVMDMQFIQSAQDLNGHHQYISADDEQKLCFYLGSTVGHGYWMIIENRDDTMHKCDLDCGAISYANHDRTRQIQCVFDSVFNIFDEQTQSWKIGSGTEYVAKIYTVRIN